MARLASTDRSPTSRRLIAKLICCVVVMLAVGSAAVAVSSADGPPASLTTTTTTTSSTETTTSSTTTSSGRLPPIIYRPSWLSTASKVPLLIALHGATGFPQAMEGLTHFEAVANEHGFVVAYLASSDLSHPWKPPSDLTYVSSMIDQLVVSENIDPSRVYVTGYSAGGYEAWRAGCQLSSKVAAIAIVSNAMSMKIPCKPIAKPVSELLIVGTADGIRWTGIRQRLPSAQQTTANWRALDGCSPQAQSTQQVSTVIEQTWSSCTDGSAVALYAIQGAGHVWPPYGTNAPQDYPTSERVWAFLSAHTAAPLTLTSADAQLLSFRVRTVRRTRTLTATFALGGPLTVVETVGPHRSHPIRTQFALAGGRRMAATLNIPQKTLGGTYTVGVTFRDQYGRTLTTSRTVTLPTAPRPARRRVTIKRGHR